MDVFVTQPIDMSNEELSPMLDSSQKPPDSIPLKQINKPSNKNDEEIETFDSLNSNNDNRNRNNENNRLLSSLHYTFMLFILTAAGPFGIEPLIASSSPLYAILSLIIVPFTYCIPQSCMINFFVKHK